MDSPDMEKRYANPSQVGEKTSAAEWARRQSLLTDSFRAFIAATGIALHVKDFSGLMMAHPQMGDFISTFLYHESEYCAAVKSNRAANEACVLTSNEQLLRRLMSSAARAREKGDSDLPSGFFGDCRWGVREYVLPVTHSGVIIGALLAGGYRADERRIERSIYRLVRRCGMDGDELKEKYLASFDECPPDFAARIPALRLFAEYISMLAEDCVDTARVMRFREDCESQRSAYVRPGTTKMVRKQSISLAVDYILKNLTSRISVADMAVYCMCSQSTLNHVFSAEIGRTIPEFVALQRVNRARHMLLATENPVERIAFDCGFSSASYFSTVFRRFTEMSPVEYRKRYSGSEKR